jgi:HK97 family phage major capsid protein
VTTAATTSSAALTRECVVEIDAGAWQTRAAGDERIPIAISSEHPVRRTDWTTGGEFLEVLDHAPGAIDLSRARHGLPLLTDHDQRELVGLVEDVRVGPDRRLRGWMRFSRSPRGQDVRQDVLDGIRRTVSVGYDPGDQVVAERDADGRAVRRFTRWQPLEVSLTAVPADPTVGVGRSYATTTTREVHVTQQTQDEAPYAPSRAERILGMAAAAGVDAATAHQLAMSERSIEEIGRYLIEQMDARTREYRGPRPLFPPLPTGGGYGTSFAERLAAALDDYPRAVRESRDAARELDLPVRGALVPLDPPAPRTRTMTSFTAGAGAEFSPLVHWPDTTDALRPASVVLEAGARQLYLQTRTAFPRLGRATATWLDENPGAGAAATDLATAQVTVRPRHVISRVTVTKQALRSALPQLASELVRATNADLGAAIDAAALAGAATGPQPVGVLHASGTTLVAAGTNGGAPTLDLVLQMEGALAQANVDVSGGLAFISTPGVRRKMRGTLDFAAAAAGTPLWSDDGRVLGHRAFATTSVPANLTKGTSTGICHGAMLGDWSQVIIAFFGGADIVQDEVTAADRGLVTVTVSMFCDVAILRPESFAVVRDFLTA